MIKVRLGDILVVCGECYNLEKIDRSVVVVVVVVLSPHTEKQIVSFSSLGARVEIRIGTTANVIFKLHHH